MAEYTFAVYRTVDLDLDDLYSTLGRGINGGKAGLNHRPTYLTFRLTRLTSTDKKQHDSFELMRKAFVDQPVSHILADHWQHFNEREVSRRFFLVVDRAAWKSEGLLVATTNFRGHVDAVRMRVGDAGDCVPALTTTTTWPQYLGADTGRGLYAGGAPATVAAYLTTDLRNDSVGDELVLCRLKGGFGGRKADSPFMGGVFGAARGSVRDVGEAKAKHPELAKKEGFHPTLFIVVTATEWSNGNCALVDLGGSGKEPVELTLETETVGELVQWFAVGLTSLEEVVKESKGGKVGPEVLFKRYPVV